MRVIVVNPPNKPFTNKSILAEPLDVLQIATIIKKRYDDVVFLDMDAKRMDNNINGYLKSNNIIVFVMDYQIPLHTGEAEKNIFEIIKNLDRQSKVIMISKTANVFFEKYFINGIDVIINKFPELIINDVISNINNKKFLHNVFNIMYKTNREVIKTERRELDFDYDTLPMIDRSMIDIDDYMDTRTIITSRGCLNHCKFCSTPANFGKWVSKSEDKIIEEILYLIETFNTKKIIFLDDNMVVDKTRMYKLLELIKKNNIRCKFGCLASINCYDEKLFKEMYACGFTWVHFGIETGSNRVLKLMNKDQNIESVKEVLLSVKEIGFRVRSSYILDYPSTTDEDLESTYELIKLTKPDELRLHYLAYRVGTPLYYEHRDEKTPQYIHSNVANIKSDLQDKINWLIEKLKSDYQVITDEIDWAQFQSNNSNINVAALVPIKYGMWWYE